MDYVLFGLAVVGIAAIVLALIFKRAQARKIDRP